MFDPHTPTASPPNPLTTQRTDTTDDLGATLRVLYILGPLSPPQWLARALADGTGGGMEVTETPSLLDGMERLREQAFDVVVVDRDASDRPAGELILAIHAGTHEHQAVLVLADGEDRTDAVDYLLAGASAYLSLRQTTTQELVWQLHRAAAQAQQQVENLRLRAWQQRYREREQHELLSLLEEQATIFGVAARLRGAADGATGTDSLSATGSRDLAQAFRDLLQAYIVMGRGQMRDEVQRLAERLHRAGCSMAQALHLFSVALQALVRDRGARSSRHIFNRGNLLLLDLLLQWADQTPRRETHEHHDCYSDL